MTKNPGNRPAEIFGFPATNRSDAAQEVRERYLCPFMQSTCDKKSRLLDFPFGVCTVEHSGGIRAVCPHRFDERGTIEGVPIVLEDLAKHYFGDVNNTVIFSELSLPNVGRIDYVIVRHKPMTREVDDFMTVEIQSDSTTSTGKLVEGMRDFQQGNNLSLKSYGFNMNTYDSIKRAITQLMNKGMVYEHWGTKCYWVIQEYIYANLANRYGFKPDGFAPGDASIFALYDIIPDGDRLRLAPTRLVSTSVEEVYQAMRHNRAIPQKDEFVRRLNAELRLKLNVPST
jgi:hypothetical protein